MHRLFEGITNRPWRRLLSAAWLALAAGCGGLEAGAEASEAPSTEGRAPQEAGPITSSSPGTTPPAEAAPAPRARPWFHRVGGPQDDLGTGLAVDGSGHLSLVWLSTPRQDAERAPVEGEQLALSLARYDPEGQRLWMREFPRNRVDAPRVVASPGGDLFLSGNAFLYDIDFGLGAASDGFLVKFSPEGEPLWQRRAGQKVYATVADASGGVFAAAEEWTPEGLLPVLAHHDAQGAFVWTRQLDVVERGTELRAAARMPSGQWLLAGRLEGVLTVDGQRFGAPGAPSLLLLAFGGDGRLAWGKAWSGVDAHVSGLKVDPAGRGVLVGQFSGDLTWGGSRLSGPGAFVLGTGAEGAERWAHALPCGQAPAAPAVALDGEGAVAAVCGDTLSLYSPEGEQRGEQALTPGECSEGNCPVVATALDFVPGHGLGLTGFQRHGDAVSGNQEAFLRLLAP
ncbi:hypothetical protein [Cystobacter ferrugineus]|uniref:Lipoprotein n=1 Tax=Cystobacter ferrugineus TaxID=83449 RepID=A0A1L9BJ90_9BACT|nr:hypothetical protein [Cystobacter ferrugineus]OJH42362.1 hypothetical protein BON30_03930 [Cystobacter ferrugineus]